jgi:hypothetical protein
MVTKYYYLSTIAASVGNITVVIVGDHQPETRNVNERKRSSYERRSR